MAEERRENLKILYKNYHDENWERGQNVWVVNSILITGSLLIAFQPLVKSSTAAVSLFLVIIADILQSTSDEVTSVTYNTMLEIEKKLGIDKLGNVAPRTVFESKIKNAGWYPIRSLASYILYSFLIGLYLLVISNILWLSSVIYLILIVLHSYIFLRKFYSNKTKKSKNQALIAEPKRTDQNSKVKVSGKKCDLHSF
jgi:hypothetical protein